jgi:hypothetical protein
LAENPVGMNAKAMTTCIDGPRTVRVIGS